MNPLLTIGAFFLIGFLMWVFFSRTVSAAATCITENESLIGKAAFPLGLVTK